MIVFFDASAIVAIITREPSADGLIERADGAQGSLTSWLAVWEAATAVARKTDSAAGLALSTVLQFCAAGRIEILSETREVVAEALAVYDRYGRRSGHPAQLNMGDCFSLAFARAEGAELLYTGNDFAQVETS